MTLIHQQNKSAVKVFCKTLYDFDEKAVQNILREMLARDAVCHLCHPFGDVAADQIYDKLFAPLNHALPDLERRDIICLSGTDQDGADWVGCAGHYVGRFMMPFLNIPPTGHIASVRYHEFFRFTDGQITEMQVIWDLPCLMMQANVWPMGLSLGHEWHVPGPASQDGLTAKEVTEDQSAASRQHVINMLAAMQKYPTQGGPEIMEMEKYWHPHFNWYGPSGIGSSRGIEGFRNWHQTPFLDAMPDRGQHPDDVSKHFFAEGAYVAVTGWPSMAQTLSGQGWLGIAPTGQKITLRSLDFWRLENGFIRENWVLVDLLDVWAQTGVDVMARMQQLAAARPHFSAQNEMEAC